MDTGPKNWIQAATKHKGGLKKKAKKAGESTMAFAREHLSSKGKTGKQSRLAETLMKLRGK